ncbi:hypothetical protein FQR65_LT09354 [Abscondita terminalis]|nr:hypothetical protein FQR65_LT09354 [Abscondita terminalis]
MYCQKCFSRCQCTFQSSNAIFSEIIETTSNGFNAKKLFKAVVLGIPGKYKTRLVEKVSNTFHLTHLSIPQVVSGHLRQDSSFGKILKLTGKTGTVLPDALLLKFVKQSISSLENKSFVITGFPSTFIQAYLFWKDVKFDIVINPAYPDDVLANFCWKVWTHLKVTLINRKE